MVNQKSICFAEDIPAVLRSPRQNIRPWTTEATYCLSQPQKSRQEPLPRRAEHAVPHTDDDHTDTIRFAQAFCAKMPEPARREVRGHEMLGHVSPAEAGEQERVLDEEIAHPPRPARMDRVVAFAGGLAAITL